jgi:hypothetical protein
MLELPFAYLPCPSLMQELWQSDTQQLPLGTRVCSFFVLFVKQVKCFDVPARGLNCFGLDLQWLILVKACPIGGEHLPHRWRLWIIIFILFCI